MVEIKLENKFQLVKVSWVDSRGCSDRWERRSSLRDMTPCECISIGYLIEKNEEVILVAGHVVMEDDNDHQFSGVMSIPRVAIHYMKKIMVEE